MGAESTVSTERSSPVGRSSAEADWGTEFPTTGAYLETATGSDCRGALKTRVFLYNFATLKLLDSIHTVSNPRGLLAMSTDPTAAGGILACSGIIRSVVRVELYHLRKTTVIEAHDGPVDV